MLLLLLLTACGAGAETIDVRYHAATGMYVAEPGPRESAKPGERIVVLSYPFATVTNVYLEVKGQGEVLAAATFAATDGPAVETPVRTPGGWLGGTRGQTSLTLRLAAPAGAEPVRLVADCGRSRRALDARVLPPPTPVDDEAGAVACQAETGVDLRPRNAYYAVRGTRLSAAQMRAHGGTVTEARRFETAFYVVNANTHAVTGRLEVVVPPWARVEATRVGFRYAGDPLFGIPQPPDSIVINDEPPLVPHASGWASGARHHGYIRMATNDTMTLTWNRFRPHSREPRSFSLHNPVSFKGQAHYEYLRQDGRWASLDRSPWMTCPIPADAARAPFKLRATCVGGVDRGNFSVQGLLSIPRNALLADDHFLPINDGDGRGSPLAGWELQGCIERDGQRLLVLSFGLEGSTSPLLLHDRRFSGLANPGPQVLVKVWTEP
jgi:hypothetical protein